MPTQWENISSSFSTSSTDVLAHDDVETCRTPERHGGSGEIEHGNWITGIPFIDNWLVGDQSLCLQELKDNKGHNVFYWFRLLLLVSSTAGGKPTVDRKASSNSRVFLFMTGIAIAFTCKPV